MTVIGEQSIPTMTSRSWRTTPNRPSSFEMDESVAEPTVEQQASEVALTMEVAAARVARTAEVMVNFIVSRVRLRSKQI